jgi:predicted N-acyltransferase
VADIQAIDQLEDVAAHDWDRLAGDDGFYQSYDWLRFVESELAEQPHYVLCVQSGILHGALPLYPARTPYQACYRSEHFRELLGIDGDYLTAGASRGFRSTLLLAPSGADREETLAALIQAALATAAAKGCAGILLPFLTTEALAEVARVAPVVAALDRPEAELVSCAGGLPGYAGRAPRKVRLNIRSDQVRFARAGWIIRQRNLEDCWPDAARLLQHLERKYGNTERSLQHLERSVAGQAKHLAGRAVVFSCEDDQGVAGISVCYRWRKTLFVRFAGFDYDRLRDGREYFNLVIYAGIQYAGEAVLERSHLGSGSWEAKGYRGATLRPLWSGFIPAAAPPGARGLELVNSGSVRQWIAEITRRNMRLDLAEWRAPEMLMA